MNTVDPTPAEGALTLAAIERNEIVPVNRPPKVAAWIFGAVLWIFNHETPTTTTSTTTDTVTTPASAPVIPAIPASTVVTTTVTTTDTSSSK